MSEKSELLTFLNIIGGTGRTVTVTDVDGKDYTLSVVVPAARQLRIAAAIEALLSEEAVRGMLVEVAQITSEGAAGNDMIGPVLKLVRLALRDNTEKIERILNDLCALAFPTLPTPAMERFELQEVIKAIVPFGARNLRDLFTAVAGKQPE